jgi:hypothetical protein
MPSLRAATVNKFVNAFGELDLDAIPRSYYQTCQSRQ